MLDVRNLFQLPRLWARGQLDISWRDLLYAALAPGLPGRAPQQVWPTREPHLVAFSVRTAWDALLALQTWPEDSEVIVSEANIPDMVNLVRAHGFVPVPASIDPATLAVNAQEVESLVTERSRAILVSPLFGSRKSLHEVSEIARRHNLLLVEDNAQGYGGPHYLGSPLADVNLFSFGLIKTRTALSGAVVFARDQQLLADLSNQLQIYPRVSTWQFYLKLGRAMLLMILSYPVIFAVVWQILSLRGIDPDVWLSQAARGIQGDDLRTKFRFRPHRATQKLLRRRLHSKESLLFDKRVRRGQLACRSLSGVLGREAESEHWAVALEVDRREDVIREARDIGFDLSYRASSVVCHGSSSTPFSDALGSSVFLPVGTDMPDAEWHRLIEWLASK